MFCSHLLIWITADSSYSAVSPRHNEIFFFSFQVIFNFWELEKSGRERYQASIVDCWICGLPLLARNCYTHCDAWTDALSWCSCHSPFSFNVLLLWPTASLQRRKTLQWHSLLNVWLNAAHSWCTIPLKSKKKKAASVLSSNYCYSILLLWVSDTFGFYCEDWALVSESYPSTD